ncbi:hypothetical protein CABS01_16808 [Colletotrichum abscissum]|uniref:Uncharacterized protein n=1 Tax=Colletotrichum abscissum TaxID=1671311 RepID=A0A9Q0AWX1_9PEZI|nr:uncharacterized protein CABS01_16808 [Colletotrichum abscissum]KAI3530646.1 hypothetical protein CABS02_14449 [Colletotrichum abscissum]KAK1511066.1 hypothetical protein CABS01_16808 [Colletotrichum abscissum]
MDAFQVARGPQPDFARIATGFTELGDQFQLCSNLPVIDHGGQLLRAVQGLREVVDSIDTRLRSMERRSIASELNALARSLNATVTRPDEPLEGLRSLQTGEVMEDFPTTVSEIALLSAGRANAYLQALGQPVAGPIGEKRRRLKLLAGVTTQVV